MAPISASNRCAYGYSTRSLNFIMVVLSSINFRRLTGTVIKYFYYQLHFGQCCILLFIKYGVPRTHRIFFSTDEFLLFIYSCRQPFLDLATIRHYCAHCSVEDPDSMGSPDPDSREQKWPTKNIKQLINFFFWSAGCSLLWAHGFSCSLVVHYGGLGISKLLFLVNKTVLRIRIRDQLPFWPLEPDPGSGIGFFRIPDLGSWIPIPYFWELNDKFLGKKFYNFLKTGQNCFLQHFKHKIIYFVKFVATKKGMTKIFFHSFVAVFGSGMGENKDPG